MPADQISLFKFNILVVDDNTICLNVISSMLRKWKYEVVTVNCPLNALAIVRVQDIDLVLSDLHMPKMNGIELQKQIEAETKLPVIIMSSDDDKEMILESLSSGAMFFISKPVNSVDLKNLWQYVVASKRDKSMRCIQKIKSIQAAGSLAIRELSSNDDNNFASSMNKGKHAGSRKDCKRKSYPKNLENEEDKNTIAAKKKKVVWNTTLHNRFLQAITHLTLEKAVPKNILEFMNVPGLTRANVASHLQKYRIALKKVVEKGFGVTGKDSMTLDSTFQTIFPTGHSIMFKNSQEAYMPSRGVLEMQTSTPLRSFNPTNFGSIGGLSSSNSRLASFSLLSPFGFGQSCLLGGNTQANVHKPFNLGDTSPLFQSNRTNHVGIIHMNDDGNLIASKGQMRLNSNTDGLNGGPYVNLINGAHTPGLGVEPVKDSTFTTSLAPGKSSCDGFNGNYQSSTSLPSVNFEQGSTSTLPSVAPQQFDLENNELNDFISELMNDNNNDASSFSKPQQFGEFTNMLMESTNFQSLHHQQQGAEGFENPNFASNLSFPSETNPPASQPLDGLDFPNSSNAKENHILEELSLEQLLDIEEFLNQDLDNIANPGDHYHPMLEKNP